MWYRLLVFFGEQYYVVPGSLDLFVSALVTHSVVDYRILPGGSFKWDHVCPARNFIGNTIILGHRC